MLNNEKLLEKYREEKSIVIGGPDERTGLETYQSFKEWKAQYVREYLETHRTVSVTEADAEIADDLKTLDPEEDITTMNEETTVSTEEETAATETPETLDKPAAKPRKKAAATKKTTAKKATAKKGPTKTDKARKIFDKFYGKKTRKEIIEKFVAQADLTPAGAATYYQKFRTEANG